MFHPWFQFTIKYLHNITVTTETSDAKKKRLASQCDYQKEKGVNESVECRENRLEKK